MKIVLATGIYPPAIGGPATYVRQLAKELTLLGNEVTVVTFGEPQKKEDLFPVHWVSRSGGPFLRWWRYATVLRTVGSSADVMYAFSSMSAGVPLWLARLKHPKKILRLGGDFLWERYTDGGGTKSLTEWHAMRPFFGFFITKFLLRQYTHIVFSSRFQEELYERSFPELPTHSVLENALPVGSPVQHKPHVPFRVLFLGRFVGFKQLPLLLEAMKELPEVHLTLVGDGPMESALRAQVASLQLQKSITFHKPVSGAEKEMLFANQDILLLPSLTEISPNTALEARASGLPVLLTSETGLSAKLLQGMITAHMRSPEHIRTAIQHAMKTYTALAEESAVSPMHRTWETVAKEHLSLFTSL